MRLLSFKRSLVIREPQLLVRLTFRFSIHSPDSVLHVLTPCSGTSQWPGRLIRFSSPCGRMLSRAFLSSSRQDANSQICRDPAAGAAGAGSDKNFPISSSLTVQLIKPTGHYFDSLLI